MDDHIKSIEEALEKIRTANKLSELDQLYIETLGKKGLISLATEQFPNLTKDEVVRIAPKVTELKRQLESEIEKRRQQLREDSYSALKDESWDTEKSAEIKPRQGHLHPVTQFNKETVELFSKIGFQQYDAPNIDTDYNNFEGLNIPENHPARDLWDTLYIDTYNLGPQPEKLLLRTHTTNAQVPIMKNYKPPIRMMILDRCYRYENLDARHEHTFVQFDLVFVDKGLNMGHLQHLSEYFLKGVFGSDVKVRLKPKYYPFVEPGAGVDGECIFCHGKGCKVCGGTGWLELAGAGMIHPKVLRNSGIDPNIYSGIAWGFGPERMVMIKNQIDDIRLLKSGDLKFLQKY